MPVPRFHRAGRVGPGEVGGLVVEVAGDHEPLAATGAGPEILQLDLHRDGQLRAGRKGDAFGRAPARLHVRLRGLDGHAPAAQGALDVVELDAIALDDGALPAGGRVPVSALEAGVRGAVRGLLRDAHCGSQQQADDERVTLPPHVHPPSAEIICMAAPSPRATSPVCLANLPRERAGISGLRVESAKVAGRLPCRRLSRAHRGPVPVALAKGKAVAREGEVWPGGSSWQ